MANAAVLRRFVAAEHACMRIKRERAQRTAELQKALRAAQRALRESASDAESTYRVDDAMFVRVRRVQSQRAVTAQLLASALAAVDSAEVARASARAAAAGAEPHRDAAWWSCVLKATRAVAVKTNVSPFVCHGSTEGMQQATDSMAAAARAVSSAQLALRAFRSETNALLAECGHLRDTSAVMTAMEQHDGPIKVAVADAAGSRKEYVLHCIPQRTSRSPTPALLGRSATFGHIAEHIANARRAPDDATRLRAAEELLAAARASVPETKGVTLKCL